MRRMGVPDLAPRPPITKISLPIVAADAWVVGVGSEPIRRTEAEAGSKTSIAELAVPLGSEPPAITILPPAAATAA